MNMQDALQPFSEKQRQLLLGTLLGDGCLVLTPTKRLVSGNYQSRHSSKQHDYNQHKYQILSEFATKPPSIVPNLGFGAFSSRWATRNSTELGCLRLLLYPNARKTICQEWLDLITEEGLAYWVMDDGAMCRKSRCMTISTHGYTEPEVRSLASWLARRFAMEVRVRTTARNGHTYWYLGLPATATDKMVELIKPFVPPCMAYKIDLGTRACGICGKTPSRRMYCSKACRRKAYLRQQHAHYVANKPVRDAQTRAWKAAHRDRVNELNRQAYWKDPAASRKRINAYRRTYDNAHRSEINAYRRRRRLERRAGNPCPSHASSMSANAPSMT